MTRGNTSDPAYFARNRKKCHIRQFHAILDVCGPGPHARSAAVIRDRCPMRIRRGNFHIISPSPTRRPARRAIFGLAADVHVSRGIPTRPARRHRHASVRAATDIIGYRTDLSHVTGVFFFFF